MRRLAASLVVVVALAARGDDLPVSLQVQLLQKTAAYITSLQPAEGGGAVKVLVVHAGPAPTRSAEALVSGINQAGTVGKYKAEAKPESVSGLKAAIDAEKPQIVWLTPELDEKSVEAVIAACGTQSIVTVSPSAAHVKQGVILGFDLVEAKPRILVHLKQAHAQNVVFLSGLLTHSVIVER